MNGKALVFGLLLFFFGQVFAQEPIPLWEGFEVAHGHDVTLTPFLAENGNSNQAVIICPGGSYFWLDDEGEGVEVARWLQNNGISAFLLRYRVAGFGAYLLRYRLLFRGKQYPDMISDVQRAMQWVRDHFEEYRIDPNQIGLMGFSAGGHLVMLSACFSKYNFLKQNGIDTNLDFRPSFVAPIYPVVTMKEPYVHKRSRRALLGDRHQHDKTMIDSLSIERHIKTDCPPVFIVNCIDDPVVDYHNSTMLDSALTAQNVSHCYIQYKTGGHGFGADNEKGTEECRQWKNECLRWIQQFKQ